MVAKVHSFEAESRFFCYGDQGLGGEVIDVFGEPESAPFFAPDVSVDRCIVGDFNEYGGSGFENAVERFQDDDRLDLVFEVGGEESAIEGIGFKRFESGLGVGRDDFPAESVVPDVSVGGELGGDFDTEGDEFTVQLKSVDDFAEIRTGTATDVDDLTFREMGLNHFAESRYALGAGPC